MAIYHLNLSVVQRSKGQSAIARSAYITSKTLWDQRTNSQVNFTHGRKKKRDTTLDLGAKLPTGETIKDQDLWNLAEMSEKRKDGRTARSLIIALPCECSRSEQIAICENLRSYLHEKHKVGTQIAIHFDNLENPHAHVLFTTRRVKKDGNSVVFGEKTTEFDNIRTGKEATQRLREEFEKIQNSALAKYGVTVSCQTLEAQGIDRPAQRHEGVKLHNATKNNRYDAASVDYDIIRHNQLAKEIKAIDEQLAQEQENEPTQPAARRKRPSRRSQHQHPTPAPRSRAGKAPTSGTR